MRSNYNLNCIVFGDGPRHIFPIEIAETKTVGALKELIKEKKKHAFREIDADRLELWNVNLLVDGTLEHNINNLELDPEKSPSPVAKLHRLFSDLPEEDHLHIVVQGPPAASSGLPVAHLSLNCFVYGDEPGCIFPIEIAETKTVGALKKLIKEDKKHAFRDVDADRLELWRVKIDSNDRHLTRLGTKAVSWMVYS